MNLQRFVEHLEKAKEDLTHFERIAGVFDAVKTLIHSGELATYSHRTYLPIMKKYHDHITGKRHLGPGEFKHVRAQMGGASRWLYHHQKKTFEDVVSLLCDVTSTPRVRPLIDHAWHLVVEQEKRLLRTRTPMKRHG